MSAAERTKDRSNLLQHWEGRVLGLSSATSRKVLSDRPALKPDWGKPTVRNFRGEDGNGSYRAILLPERQSSTLQCCIAKRAPPWIQSTKPNRTSTRKEDQQATLRT